MAIHKNPKMKQKPRSPILILTVLIAAIGLLYLLSSLNSTNGFSNSSPKTPQNLMVKSKNHPRRYSASEKYLYWGNRIDCPGKHCESCEGLGHQESSLRCALEEAMFLQSLILSLSCDFMEVTTGHFTISLVLRRCLGFHGGEDGARKYSGQGGWGKLWMALASNVLSLPSQYNVCEILKDSGIGVSDCRAHSDEDSDFTMLSCCRTFVMPSRMCINPIHNKKGILHRSDNATSEARWAASSCAMDSLYDLDLMSNTVTAILDDSETWHQTLSTSMKLGSRGIAHVHGVSRADLKEKSQYTNILLINRTASPLSWFMECKDRNNRSAIMLPYSFLPSMASKKLRDAAEKINALLGDYDAIHVRRGDKLKTRKDRFGVDRALHPHLDRDTRPEFILCRISKWVPPGRTLFIASNERTPGFFSPLAVRYKLAYSSNYSSILDPVIENNYQLFMIERLIMMGAKTFIRTFKEDDNSLSLTDDPKKNTKAWQIPVYTMDGKEC
ncbi:hypothetical protein Acr_00g0048150 [Actinidia rufa]|uniref:O-fucosyltransferase family protein n=1 Tax=Actinidia rufa TaxID=165716 RepID=A0A7J0DLT9_9ERIC|nr:hypothetical protein Acr_00g0048150 [Actinidia rufa]